MGKQLLVSMPPAFGTLFGTLWNTPAFETFKHALKTYLFDLAYHYGTFISLLISVSFQVFVPPPPQQLSLSLTITVLSSPLWCQCGYTEIPCSFISGNLLF